MAEALHCLASTGARHPRYLAALLVQPAASGQREHADQRDGDRGHPSRPHASIVPRAPCARKPRGGIAGVLDVMSRQVVSDPADGWGSDGGVVPVVIVEVQPAGQGLAALGL